MRLIAVIVGAIVLADVLHGFPVLIVVLALVAMVMLHEFGHLVTAKLSGMKVTEYFLGFGPKLWSIRRGETEYGIKLIPAGGYVRIIGMTSAEKVDPADEPRTYRQATFPRRILVAVAGSTMHFVMALVLLWSLFTFAGIPTATTAQVQAMTTFVGQSSPAQAAGIHVGDEIIAINGHHFANPTDVVNYIEARPGQLLTVEVLRNNHDVTVHVRPQLRSTIKVRTTNNKVETLAPANSSPKGAIGVEIKYLTTNETTNPAVAVQRAGSMLVSMTGQTFAGIGQVFSIHGLSAFFDNVKTASQHATSSTSSSSTSSSSSNSGQLLSIYGAVELGAQAAQQDVPLLLYLLVAINLFVGIINLFPMLPLDGGHVVVAIYERLRSYRGRAYHADVTKLNPVIYLFVVFILVMGLAALYANIVQPVSLPGR